MSAQDNLLEFIKSEGKASQQIEQQARVISARSLSIMNHTLRVLGPIDPVVADTNEHYIKMEADEYKEQRMEIAVLKMIEKGNIEDGRLYVLGELYSESNADLMTKYMQTSDAKAIGKLVIKLLIEYYTNQAETDQNYFENTQCSI